MDKRVALITGAGMGIGAAVAERLTQDGYVVVVSDIDEKAANQVADRLGKQAWALTMDVSNAESISAGFAALAERSARCDVLVNNAGVAKTFPFIDFPLDEWRRHLDINVTGTFLCGQHAARMMRQRGSGRIVNLASVAGMRASPGRTAYGTSKAAVIALTRQMAIDLAPFGITANAVAPGPIATALTQQLHSQTARQAFLQGTPAARYGTPAEVAAAVAFLVSDDASYVTGHIMAVDGGLSAAGLLAI
jgi:3-oxoacyl-[acyl-carrier protein] reductase